MYMSGFFPCMMFGVAGAALAMIKAAKNKKGCYRSGPVRCHLCIHLRRYRAV